MECKEWRLRISSLSLVDRNCIILQIACPNKSSTSLFPSLEQTLAATLLYNSTWPRTAVFIQCRMYSVAIERYSSDISHMSGDERDLHTSNFIDIIVSSNIRTEYHSNKRRQGWTGTCNLNIFCRHNLLFVSNRMSIITSRILAFVAASPNNLCRNMKSWDCKWLSLSSSWLTLMVVESAQFSLWHNTILSYKHDAYATRAQLGGSVKYLSNDNILFLPRPFTPRFSLDCRSRPRSTTFELARYISTLWHLACIDRP